MSKGPSRVICTTVGDAVHAKWCIFAGSETNPPGSSDWLALRSSLSPIPTWSAPESTVTRSVMLCQCAGNVVVGGKSRRSVTAPFSEGLPSSTLISAPAGREGGAGAHCTLSARTRTCVDWAKEADCQREAEGERRELDCETDRMMSHKLPPRREAYEGGAFRKRSRKRSAENPLFQAAVALKARQFECPPKGRLARGHRLELALLEIQRRKPPPVSSLERQAMATSRIADARSLLPRRGRTSRRATTGSRGGAPARASRRVAREPIQSWRRLRRAASARAPSR